MNQRKLPQALRSVRHRRKKSFLCRTELDIDIVQVKGDTVFRAFSARNGLCISQEVGHRQKVLSRS